MQRIVTILTLVVTAIVATGCGSAATIPKWQQQVEQYIDREGGGNFAALRDLGSDDAVRRIGVFGSKQGVVAPKRTDVNSVIVGHRRVGDDNWLLFIVARVQYDGGVVDVQFDQPHVIDLRAAAVRRDGDDYRW